MSSLWAGQPINSRHYADSQYGQENFLYPKAFIPALWCPPAYYSRPTLGYFPVLKTPWLLNLPFTSTKNRDQGRVEPNHHSPYTIS